MRMLPVLSLCLVSTAAFGFSGGDAYYDLAISSDAGDPDAPVHGFIDISTTGNRLAISDIDDDYQALTGAFSFTFYGRTYAAREIFVTTNGTISFGDPQSDFCCSAVELPTSALGFPGVTTPILNVAQEDLNPSSRGDIYQQVVGDELIIQYNDTPYFPDLGQAIAQARLNLVTGEIHVSHAAMDSAGQDTSIGMQRNPLTGISAFFGPGVPSDTTYYFAPNGTTPNADDASDIVAFAPTQTAAVDSGPARLSTDAITRASEAVQAGAQEGHCELADTFAGTYSGGSGTAATGFLGAGALSTTFSLGDKSIEGTFDGEEFTGAFDRNGRLFAALPDGSILAGRWARDVGSSGIWYGGIYEGCLPGAFSDFPGADEGPFGGFPFPN